MNEQILSCVDLYKSFAEGELQVDVLRGVNMEVSRGESIAIMGTSGSGKSTLLHLLGGLDLPNKGEISIVGKNTLSLTDAERGILRNESLGFIYQFHHLLPEWSRQPGQLKTYWKKSDWEIVCNINPENYLVVKDNVLRLPGQW
jgi:lipoprotein-releasing system ATP-binding protein